MVGDPDFHAVKAGCGMVWYSMVCCWKEQNVGYGVGKIMCGGPEFHTRKKNRMWYGIWCWKEQYLRYGTREDLNES